MKQPTIGIEVVVSRIAHFNYNDDGIRVCTFEPVTPETYFLVGIRNRPIGKYIKGSTYGGGIMGSYEEDYSPPELNISGTVKVALVTKGIRRNCISIPYEDLEKQLED